MKRIFLAMMIAAIMVVGMASTALAEVQEFAPSGQTIVCNPVQWSSYWGAPYQWCKSTQYGWYISWS